MTTNATTPIQQSGYRIHFGENEVHIIDAEEFDANSWLDADEMKGTFRNDVIAFLKEFKRNQTREEVSDDEDSEDEEEREPVCSRGLELYFPGQIKHRRKLRMLYSANVLRKSRELDAFFEDPANAEEHLQIFASALSQTTQKKAHALALQDAIEARLIFAEALEEATAKRPAAFEYVRTALEYLSIKHESNTEPATSKARAA